MTHRNEDEIKGRLEQTEGALKEGYGAATGDRSKELEGKTERAKGNLREEWGETKRKISEDDEK